MISRIEKELQAVRNVVVNYPQQYNQLLEMLTRLDQERQDLLHVLELASLDAVKQSKIARELKKVSAERRRVKNELEVLQEISNLVESGLNNDTIGIAVGKIRKIARSQENRRYYMRVRKDLQKYVDGK